MSTAAPFSISPATLSPTRQAAAIVTVTLLPPGRDKAHTGHRQQRYSQAVSQSASL
jgi:hypothetical protein